MWKTRHLLRSEYNVLMAHLNIHGAIQEGTAGCLNQKWIRTTFNYNGGCLTPIALRNVFPLSANGFMNQFQDQRNLNHGVWME